MHERRITHKLDRGITGRALQRSRRGQKVVGNDRVPTREGSARPGGPHRGGDGLLEPSTRA